jgi:hypothetical protein
MLARREDVMITDDVEADLQALRHPGQLCRTTQQTLTPAEKRIFMAPDPGLQTAVDAWPARAMVAGTLALQLEQAMHRFATEADPSR